MTRKKKRQSNSESLTSRERHESDRPSSHKGTPVENDVSETCMNQIPPAGDLPDAYTEPPEKSETDNEIVDILGNGLLLKKVLNKGVGRESRPNHGDLVQVSYKGYLDNGTIVDEASDLSFTLGDGDVVQALDLALPLAERGECFELITDARFAFGSRGREPEIPGDARIRYEVKLLSASEPPAYSSLPDSERLLIADQKRERGNYYYRREEFAFAVNSYNKALKVVSSENLSSTPSTKASTELLEDLEIKLLNNLAATQLKIQAYEAAVKSCDAVLNKDPRNFKALFRKGKALLEQGEVDEAIPLLRLVHEIVPTSAMVSNELNRARTLQQRERERWSRAASKLLPQRNKSTGKATRVSRFFSPRWKIVLLVALLVLLLSIGLAWYFDQIPSFDYVINQRSFY